MPTDEIISINDVIVSPRGRRAEYNQELISKFKKLAKGKAIRVNDFGEVPQSKRTSVRDKIKKHWEQARDDEPVIRYSPEGIPQVYSKNDEPTPAKF